MQFQERTRSTAASLVFLVFTIQTLHAQDAGAVRLSSNPTAREVANAFISAGLGKIDPFIVLPSVIQKGDLVIPQLSEALYSDSLVGFAPAHDSLHPNKLFAVMALEGIGSSAAYAVLFQAAQVHRNLDVRGCALNALANTYHTGEYLERFRPDKELVHLLLRNVDDTTNVGYLGRSLGQIAREGMINWVGWDTGEPQGMETILPAVGDRQAQTLSQSREEWWQAYEASLIWDHETAHYKIR